MIPLSKDEISSFTPASWASLAPAPSFRFRPPTPRDRRRYNHALTVEGLRFYPDETIQAEILRAMRELWAGDANVLAANESRMKAFWESVKQAAKDDTVAVDPHEADAIGEAVMKLLDAWPPLRRMNADNVRFNNDAPKIALSIFLCGWSNIETTFRMEDGQVPLETLDAVETEIEEIEKKARAENVDGVLGTGFVELSIHALGLMNLGKVAEKNSPSPSPSSDDPGTSTIPGTEAADSSGESESISSKPETTPATTSPKKPGKS